MPGRAPIPLERIIRTIQVIRGQRVMLDADLAQLYGVETKTLNRAVRRNSKRFPDDFMFRLTPEEARNLKYQSGTSSSSADPNLKLQTVISSLRSQIVTSSAGWGGRRKLPSAFSEHGAVMLASVLNSPVAVEASIQVVRAFIQLRALVSANADLAGRLDKMEGLVFDAIRLLIRPPDPPPRKQVGFRLRT